MPKTNNYGKYILDEDGNVREETDLLKWALWFENSGASRTLDSTKIGSALISTVFLGLDYDILNISDKPILWETMIFSDDKMNGQLQRYTSAEDALIGHEEMVERYKLYKN